MSKKNEYWVLKNKLGQDETANQIVHDHNTGVITDKELWEVLSDDYVFDGKHATLVYESLGFEPHAGFPLKKKYSKGGIVSKLKNWLNEPI